MKKRATSELKRYARECLLGKYPAVMLAMLISFFLPSILIVPYSIDLPEKLNVDFVIYVIALVIIQILGQLLYPAVMLAMLISFFLPSILIVPYSIDLPEKLNVDFVIYVIALVIIQILGQLLAAGVLRMHLLLAQNQQVVFRDLFWIFRNRPDRFILATVLLYAILAVPIILTGVIIYFFIPDEVMERAVFLSAVILLMIAVELYLIYMFEFIYPLYMEHPEMTIWEGFQTSKSLMHGNKKRLFLLQLSFIGWQILGFCSMGIGFLWIGPYMTQTTANFYLDITGGLDPKGVHMDVSIDEMI